MARGHQKELSRQRNEKNGPGNKPTTQKGTAGMHRTTSLDHRILLFDDYFLAAALTYQCAICKVSLIDVCARLFRCLSRLDPNGRSQNIQVSFRKQTSEK
jgi:hypothetical protein